MSDALLVRWFKQAGDSVLADEPVAEIETDKTTLDLASPVEGVLGEHLFAEGAIVPVGEAITRVSSGETTNEDSDPEVDRGDEPGPGEGGFVITTESAPVAVTATATAQAKVARSPHAQSPRARRLAAEAALAGETGGNERFRDAIAARVTESWRTIPHFAVTREVDAESMSAIVAAERAAGRHVSLTDVLVFALAAAHRQTGTAGTIDIGLAVATDNGVVIPVIRDVLGHPLGELAVARQGAVERARGGRLSADDVSVIPPSTLSNLGSRGVDQFTGVIALGQQTLLTVGRVIPRIVADDDGRFSLRRTLFATLNADHRVLDGAHAADLLVAFADCLENETTLGKREEES